MFKPLYESQMQYFVIAANDELAKQKFAEWLKTTSAFVSKNPIDWTIPTCLGKVGEDVFSLFVPKN
jgi:hypothetical protein